MANYKRLYLLRGWVLAAGIAAIGAFMHLTGQLDPLGRWFLIGFVVLFFIRGIWDYRVTENAVEASGDRVLFGAKEPMDRRNDAEAEARVEDYRQRFAHGPVGRWKSDLDMVQGPGFEGTGLMGAAIEFLADGTGHYAYWSALSGEEKGSFQWREGGELGVDILIWETEEDRLDPDKITCDFFMVPQSEKVLMASRVSQDGIWFWHLPGPFFLVE